MKRKLKGTGPLSVKLIWSPWPCFLSYVVLSIGLLILLSDLFCAPHACFLNDEPAQVRRSFFTLVFFIFFGLFIFLRSICKRNRG